MGRYSLAWEIHAAIQQQGESIELTDPTGHLVGYYLTPGVYRKMAYQYANTLVTDEELEISRRTPGGCTSEELIQRLATCTQ